MPGREVIYQSEQFKQLFFVMEGQVNMSNYEAGQFMALTKRAVFGDYALLFNLKSNISFRTISDPNETHESYYFIPDEIKTSFMCCKKEMFLDLCELFPQTQQALRELSLHKRDIYMHFLH